MIFRPNLFGKICFVLFSCLEYWFVVRPIVIWLRTYYILIDILIYFIVQVLCAIISVELIWKILRLYERKVHKN